MELPAELSNLLTPANAHNALNGIEHWIFSKVTGALGDRLWKVTLRRIAPMLADGDFDLLAKRIARLEAFTAGFEAERIHAQSVDDEVEASNRADPAFDEFLERAIQSATSTASEGKQLLIGRIAGKRAATRTESFLDLQSRAALSITDRSSLQQLYAIGALLLIGNTPLPPPPADVRAILQDYDRVYYPALKEMIDSPWTPQDLTYLASIGAMMHDDTNQAFENITSRLGRRLTPGGPYQPVPVNVVTSAMSAFWTLAEEFDTQIHQPQTNPRSLVAFSLTPAGIVLGVTIVEGLCPDVTIALPEEWKRAV